MNKEKLTVERRKRLDELGFIWAQRDQFWEEGFDFLKVFKQREGHCRVSAKYKENGYPLGQWVVHQRQAKGKLTVERRQRLEKLGFVWDVLEQAWEEGFSCLKVFKQREGHCRASAKYKENGYPLGQWIGVQRLNKDALSDERRQRLNELGFIWDGTPWEQGFEHLQAFVKEHKHCRVPTEYKSPDGYKLGQWVSNKRLSQDKLSHERKARLDALGFDWDPIRTRR
jgi:hypothetical protein